MGWNQYQDKLTLNSSTSSSCKQEVWRLKHDLKTSSRVGGRRRRDNVEAMPPQTNRKWLEMGRHRTSLHTNLRVYKEYNIMLRKRSSPRCWARSMKGVSAGAVMHCGLWQTHSDTNYTLRLASIKPHFHSTHASCRCIPVADECNGSTGGHGPDGKWIGIDWTRPGVCVSDPAWEGSRVAGGGMVSWFPFCLHLQFAAVKVSFLKAWLPLAMLNSAVQPSGRNRKSEFHTG